MITNPSFWLVTATSVVIFWLLRSAWRPAFLSIVSTAYLGYLEPAGTCFLIGWSFAFFYGMRRAVGNGPAWTRRSVSLLLAGIFLFLGYFKYFPALVEALGDGNPALEVLLPMGISYYTFRLAHYAIEVGRGNIPQHNLGTFLSYITLYPVFSAGPVERFDHFLGNRQESWSITLLVEGGSRIIQGLVKKFVIIDLFVKWPLGGSFETSKLVGMLDETEPYKVWAWLFLKFFYAYLDFSAYSDIAIGVSRLFGFRIAENFRWPILAANIVDFWSRWHMTLVSWIRAYLYMPVVGWTRNPYLATFITFIAIAVWHEASLHWLSWGCFHAFGVIGYSALTRVMKKKKWKFPGFPLARFAGISLTLAFVSAGGAFIFTAEADLPYAAAWKILGKIFVVSGGLS